MQDQINFSHELIKGRIAETIFEMMFRATDKFAIFRFGYEYTEPLLAQCRKELKLERVLDNISNAPDFILLTNTANKKQAYVVEVKYRHNLNTNEIFKIASKISKTWNPSYLFIVSRGGFYFDPTNKIILNRGRISPLSKTWVEQSLQGEYLKLAGHFLKEHTE